MSMSAESANRHMEFLLTLRRRGIGDQAVLRAMDEVPRERTTAVLSALVRLVAEGALDPYVTDVRPFEEAPAAMRAVEGGHALGKVALRV